MQDLMIALVVMLIVALAAWHIIRAKKRGQKCIGCPYAKECSGKGGCSDN